jgi:hypothetical protein
VNAAIKHTHQPARATDRRSPAVDVEVRYCIPQDQEKHLPKRRRAPAHLPPGVPIPRQGEVIYLSSSSAWAVAMVIHEWANPRKLQVQLWLEFVSSSRERRPTGFQLSQ